MTLPFDNLDTCMLFVLQENYNPNGKHLEYKDKQGKTLAKMEKVFKQGAFLALFAVFSSAPDVHAELKDAEGRLMLTTTAYWGKEMQERKVEIHAPDGTLLGIVYDADHGADFARPNGTIIGHARRPDTGSSAYIDATHTYTDAAGQVVGTCQRDYPERDQSVINQLFELATLTAYTGLPFHTIAQTAATDAVLHLHLFLFPALQYLRYTHNG